MKKNKITKLNYPRLRSAKKRGILLKRFIPPQEMEGFALHSRSSTQDRSGPFMAFRQKPEKDLIHRLL